MADSTGSVSLVRLLIGLLSDHVAREAEFIQQTRRCKLWADFESTLKGLRANNAKLPQGKRLTAEKLKEKAQRTLLVPLINRRFLEVRKSRLTTKAEETVIEERRILSGPKPEEPTWETTNWQVAVGWLSQRSKFFHSIKAKGVAPIDKYESLLRSYVVDVKRGGPTRSNEVAAELDDFELEGLTKQICTALGKDLPSDFRDQLEHSSSKRRGRKKADYQTVQREAQLATDWTRARDARTSKADFAKQQGLKVRDLDALLDRVSKRKNTSE